MTDRPPTVRVLRDADGPVLVVDPARIETIDGLPSIRLTATEEAWLAGDLASLHQARVWADPATWGR